MYQHIPPEMLCFLIEKIWQDKEMPSDYEERDLVKICNKGDPAVAATQKGMA